MKVAIISDIHENAHNLVVALEECQKLKVEKILFLGDFVSPLVVQIFATAPIPTFAIWGNNDGDRAAILRKSLAPGSKLEIGIDMFDIIMVDGRNIFMTHYPILAKPMAKSGDFDAVFYGHNHKSNMDMIGTCLVVNPGELGGHKFGIPSFALYDTTTNTAEIILLEGGISLKSNKVDTYLDNIGFVLSSSKGHKY